MRVLVVDDEAPARSRLRALLDDIPGVGAVDEAANGLAALERFGACEFDLLLLDIRMPGMDGLEVARHLSALETPPAIIFTTAFEEHALAAFQANAVAYLLKPIDEAALATAIERSQALTRVQLGALRQGSSEGRSHLSASINGSLRLLAVDDVLYLRAEHKYVTARHGGGELVIDDALSALEEEFGERFLRVHRNALVARERVAALVREPGGHHAVTFDGIDDRVEVSRRLLSNVRRSLRA